MDESTLFFTRQGFEPKHEFFMETDYILGLKFNTKKFSLTYRQEDDRMIICHFAALVNDGLAVLSLISLLKKMIKEVPKLHYIDALFLEPCNDSFLAEKRRKLCEVMSLEGGKPVEINGEKWLRCSF